MSKLFLIYFEEKDCSFFVKPYLNSSNFTIAFQCKATLAAFSEQLSEARHLLVLSEVEVNRTLNLIGDALHSPKLLTSYNDSTFSAMELLASLIALLINTDNRLQLCNQTEFVPIIVTALTSGDVIIESAACLLLWSMLELFSLPSMATSRKQTHKKEFLLPQEKDVIAKKHTAHCTFYESLKDSELYDVLYDMLESKAVSDDNVAVLCRCVLWAIGGIDFSGWCTKSHCEKCISSYLFVADDKQVLTYMEQCCKYGRYQECLNCYHITFVKEPLLDSLIRAKYLTGKSCFYIYREKQRQLEFVSLSNADMYRYRDSYCALMFEAVKFLGISHDQGLLLKDDKWMLDRAMIDYIHATNNLKDCARCLLCLKKSRDICRSHFCPRKILERFVSGCYMPKDMKALLSLHEGNVVSCDTPKTETLYMFCPSCEDLFSQNGESQFLPKFFDKLYDIGDLKDPPNSKPTTSADSQDDITGGAHCIASDSTSNDFPPNLLAGDRQNGSNTLMDVSSMSSSMNITSLEPLHLSQSKDIVYDRWLYLFCIGVVFRGIAYISKKSYVNNNELYDLFVKCRECLLKAPNIDDVENLPVVEILISPSMPSPGDERHGFIHSAMRMLYQFTIGITTLQNGVFSFPQEAHFVLAQVGIINILVKLPPSHDVPATPNCIINSSKGVHVYHVPASKERRSLCYQGVWEVIHATAQELLEAWWQRPKQFCPQDKNKPPDDVMDLYNIEASGFTDLHLLEGILPAHPNSLQPTTLDFLPEGFYLDSSMHVIRFPDSHRVLAHKCFHDGLTKTVYFIAVGQTGVYNSHKPYTVVHFSVPGVVVKVGFFIDVRELVALDFLPDRKTREMLQDVKIIEKIRSDLCNNLFTLLQEKGFCSLVSLLECHSRYVCRYGCRYTIISQLVFNCINTVCII